MNQLNKELERLEARDKDELIQELQHYQQHVQDQAAHVQELEAINEELQQELDELHEHI